MPYENGAELKADVLFRAGEAASGSDWDAKALDYLNRSYKTLASGASEFLPEFVDDWWWMRGAGVLTLEPIQDAGTVSVTKDSDAITFSVAPVNSVAGYRFRVQDHSEIFKVFTHTGNVPGAVLDSPWTGPTSAAATYKLMRVEYTLDVTVQALMSPMIGYHGNHQIIGLSPEGMDGIFPLPELAPGIPRAFSLENTQRVRFSHGGREDGESMRVEYRFRHTVDALSDDINSIPLVPEEYRQVLADMALTYVWLDKNDDRSNATALGARTMLAAMFKDNRRRLAKMGGYVGHIFPRANHSLGRVQTMSGLILR